MLSFEEQSLNKESPYSSNTSSALRIVDLGKSAYDLWVRREGETFNIVVDVNSPDQLQFPKQDSPNEPAVARSEVDTSHTTTPVNYELLPILDSPSSIKAGFDPELLAVKTKDSLDKLCGQFHVNGFTEAL